MKVAAIQMVSSPQVTDNLAVAVRLIDEAAQQGAELVVLPEYFCLRGRSDGDTCTPSGGRMRRGSGENQRMRERVLVGIGNRPLR